MKTNKSIQLIGITALGLITTALFQNCSGGFSEASLPLETKTSFASEAPENTTENNTENQTDTKYYVPFTAANYYRGGWYSQTGNENWSDDFNLDVLENLDVSINSSLIPNNQFCKRSAQLLALKDKNQLHKLIATLKIKKKAPGDPTVADLATEKITIRYFNGDLKTIHLAPFTTPVGSLYATNGEDLSKFLQDINKNLPEYCY